MTTVFGLKTADDERIQIYIKELLLLREEINSSIAYAQYDGEPENSEDVDASFAYMGKIKDAMKALAALLPENITRDNGQNLT